jgi:hypothetical protein
MELNLSSLHYAIIRSFVDHGHAPSVASLCSTFGRPRSEVIKALQDLQDYHGVVLHPGPDSEIWCAHPFSSAPTGFWVERGSSDKDGAGGSCWANCAWCSMGVAALFSPAEVTISTVLGAERKQVTLKLLDGKLREEDAKGYFVHFAIPMRQAWNNVIYTCSMMLLFDSEAAIDEWCRRHQVPKGDVQPLGNVWEFAKVWYGGHLNPQWKKWTMPQAQEIFDRFGLRGPVWDLGSNQGRF